MGMVGINVIISALDSSLILIKPQLSDAKYVINRNRLYVDIWPIPCYEPALGKQIHYTLSFSQQRKWRFSQWDLNNNIENLKIK